MAQKKKARLKERRLNAADKIIAATLAASTVLSPVSAAAGQLTATKIEEYTEWTDKKQNGDKFTITPKKTNDDKGFNRFKNFQLKEGHIANMILPGQIKNSTTLSIPRSM